MSYDPKCEELAEYFMPSGTSRKTIQHLAQRIQDFIEDDIQSMIEEVRNPDPYVYGKEGADKSMPDKLKSEDSAALPSQQSTEEPKLDYFPDGGWGMKISPDTNLTPEEALDYAKRIEESRKHPESGN